MECPRDYRSNLPNCNLSPIPAYSGSSGVASFICLPRVAMISKKKKKKKRRGLDGVRGDD